MSGMKFCGFCDGEQLAFFFLLQLSRGLTIWVYENTPTGSANSVVPASASVMMVVCFLFPLYIVLFLAGKGIIVPFHCLVEVVFLIGTFLFVFKVIFCIM
mgnify:CR=1 FL=1